MQEYIIDYEMFNAMEIIKIIEFFQLIESAAYKKVNRDLLISKYKEYRNIINNKSLEKKYDKMFYKKTKISIYKTMKTYIEKSFGK